MGLCIEPAFETQRILILVNKLVSVYEFEWMNTSLIDDCWVVWQCSRRMRRRKRRQCSESTIDLDQGQLWDFAAALQEKHPGLALLNLPAYILQECCHIKGPVSNEPSACYVTAIHVFISASAAQKAISGNLTCIKCTYNHI